MGRHRIVFAAALLLASAVGVTSAQEFGQNKITYMKFEWSVYRSPHFDIHYYREVEPQLEQLISEAESAYLDISRRLDHEIKFRIPLILYRTHAEFEQTNVTLSEIPEAVGAFAEPFQNRMVLPIDEPSDRRYKLIRHELTHVFQFDIFYGGSLSRALRAQPPLWLTEGMASYLGDDEDTFDQMVIRDAVVNNLVPSVRRLNVLSFLTYRFGHAIFDFIESTYGPQGMRTFLFEFRKVLLTPTPEKAFQDAFGMTVDGFDRRFARFLRQRYLPVLSDKRGPEEYGPEIGFSEPGRYTFGPALSPSGEVVAALATPKLELDVVLLSAKDGSLIRNLTKGFTNSFDNVVTGAFEGKRDLSWSPDGDQLAFFVRREDHRELRIYEALSGKVLHKVPFRDIADCTSPAFSPDGLSIAFSGNKDGVWDIFRYDLRTSQTDNVTQDEYYDGNPAWSLDGKAILYNRRIGSFAKIFTVEVGAPERKAQLTAGAASDIQPVFSKDGRWVYFSSDRGEFGVFNLHRLEIVTGRVERLTDLVGGAFTPAELNPADDGSPQLAFTVYSDSVFRLHKMKVAGPEVDRAIAIGRNEPASSPLAPSRRAAAEKARKAQATPPGETLRPEAPTAQAGEGAAPGEAERAQAPATQPDEAAPPPSPQEESEEDLLPFQPPLQLGIDRSRTSAYKKQWDIDIPSLTVGVTDDGTFLSDVAINFSDLLGDNRVMIRFSSLSNYTNIYAAYVNLKRRIDWGLAVSDYRDYYYVGDPSGAVERVEQAQRYSTAVAFASYPFSKRYRIEGDVGYAQRRVNYPQVAPFDPTNPGAGYGLYFDEYSDDFANVSLALVGDTTRWQEWGPFQGKRFRLQATGLRFTGGDSKGETIGSIALDYRGYQHLTARSLLAFRFTGIKQTAGERNTLYSLGGINQLRGYEFREFFGPNIAWANLELRFPLIDAMRWGFGMTMGPLRGFLFADVGTTWFEDTLHFNCTESGENLLLCDPQPVLGKAFFDPKFGVMRNYEKKRADGTYRDLFASAGVGFHVDILGLPFTWSFAQIYDGDDFSSAGSSFYIVWDW